MMIKSALSPVGSVSLAGRAPGRSRHTWETGPTGGDADVIIIVGSWPLPPGGQGPRSDGGIS